MANLTREDLLKLAQLARLDLSEDEINEFAEEINKILTYVEQLQAADVNGLEPTYQVTGLTNVMRDDVIKDYGYKPSDLLKNVPEVEHQQIKTKRILG
jgi:aspartyl-tRNA(Asn)/glutamyl-tRNA(Gln) amidotransferase subunit C